MAARHGEAALRNEKKVADSMLDQGVV